MASNIDFDATDFLNKVGGAISKVEGVARTVVKQVADEVLRLSQFEVPHDTGALQNSGHTESGGNMEEIVGYNKVYAARLHENPQYRFQKGRKGKYLEDPIKNNMQVFQKYLSDAMRGAF